MLTFHPMRGAADMTAYLIPGLAMAIGLVGMILCARHRGGRDNGGPWRLVLMLVFLLVILAGGCFIAFRSLRGGGLDDRTAAETFDFHSAGLVLGRHLAAAMPGASALVIVEDKDSPELHYVAGLAGLREGMGAAVRIVEVASPHDEDEPASAGGGRPMSPERRIHLRKKTSASALDRLLKEYSDCDLVISFVGLSQNPQDMSIWSSMRPEERPRIVLFRSNVRPYREAIRAGAIQAAVVTRPDFAPGQGKVPGDPQAAFGRRFLLVTPENVDQIAAEHPIFDP